LVIDEAQRVPGLFSEIQVIVDADPLKKIVISGSQNFLLDKNISQSLAGRVAVFILLPLALGELRRTRYWKDDYSRFLVNGLYPRIYDKQIKPSDWYANYLETYVERDVGMVLDVKNKDQFIDFLISCAANAGSIVNYNSLASTVGISPNTAKSWLSILRQSYLVTTLQPYFENINKQLRKSPKLYFHDTGLLCYLLNIRSKADYKKHYLRGQIFENLVINEIYKRNFNQYGHQRFYYLRDKIGREVDLLYKESDRTVLMEIKSSSSYGSGFGDNLIYYQNLLAGKIESYVLYNGKEMQKRSRFTLIKWQDWLFRENKVANLD